MSSDKRHKKKRSATGSPRLVQDSDHTPPQRVVRPCVLLAPVSQVLPDSLHAALSQAGLTPRMEHDPEMAMAELCLLRREHRQHRIGGQTSEPSPLVLAASPSEDTLTMLDALTRHVPDIPVLHFDGSTLQTHRAASPDAEPPVVAHPPSKTDVSDAELASLLAREDLSPSGGQS